MDTVDLLGMGFASLAIFLVYLSIRLPAKYHIKYLATPALFILGILFIEQFPNIMGLPKHGFPDKEFSLLSYRTTFIGAEHVIEIWINEGKTSRLYQFPYSSGLQEELAQMMEDGKNGKYEKGKFKKRYSDKKVKGGTPGMLDDYDIDVQDITVTDLPPKQ